MARQNRNNAEVVTNRGNGRKDRPSKQKRRAIRALLFTEDGNRTAVTKADAKRRVEDSLK